LGNSVKGLTKVQVDDIHSISLIQWAGHLIIEGDQVGQQDLPFMNPCWLGLIPSLYFTYPVSSLWMNRSIIFLGTKVRLTGL